MLLLLRIQNFALIDSLELEFGAGLNVLTGETGAGKSIILDAIDVVLGGKVNSRMIRTGSDRSFIEATFAIHPGVIDWLTQQEVEPLEEQVLVCSREIANGNSSMRSRCRVNFAPAISFVKVIFATNTKPSPMHHDNHPANIASAKVAIS